MTFQSSKNASTLCAVIEALGSGMGKAIPTFQKDSNYQWGGTCRQITITQGSELQYVTDKWAINST